jgi:hypothetical protein
MQLNEIFVKDVQRPIEGVVKADDVVNLAIEVDEYVLTNEAAKGVELLLETYTNYTNANGVWISGFFGSGKSHLLKMLAHLLGDVEGQDFPRSLVSDSFRSKAKDAFLPALLSKAGLIEAKSILFNIDQKATLIAKDQSDALLRVFVKVFNESRGYYGNQGHVAQFERDLDVRGQYDTFKAAYERIANHPWSQGREQSTLEAQSIDRAFSEINGETATNIISQYNSSYAVSIEDFADEVNDWLSAQPDGFRLNFFVDEVGQFIGTNTHLMLNLQTIAESLNTKCAGRAWVFVTSQEDMDKVVGDRTKQQSNDFSKIQARFKTRLKLTSADVEEVIRKRLLEKNDAGAIALGAVFELEQPSFKTIFDFADGAKTYRNYVDISHFVGTYPFVGYQFPLFQAAIEGISDHNVFEGKNSSVGERSMLGVVQQVAKDFGDYEVGTLATFDQMFDGIRASLKSAAQRSIGVAERNLDNKLAIRLLKALFLVKYVESFQATARNLTVLVYDRFGLDMPALSKQVKEALSLLEIQTYVQRTGNVYEYLTNEEQKIEEEIKNVDIDASEMSNRLFKILSSDVIKSKKLRYANSNRDFPFGFKLDDQVHGPQGELAIHFITPEYPYTPTETRMHSAGKDELRVVLEPDERVLAELRLLLKTEKYTKRKHTTSLSVIDEQILRSKATQNVEREKEIIQRISKSVGSSEMVINAAEVTSNSHDALTRVTDGFQDLVSRTYTHLSLLGGVSYREEQVAGAATAEDGLFDADALSKLAGPSEEVLSLVIRKGVLGEHVTVKTIVDFFQAKPYGWDLASIEVIVASLIGSSKLTITVDGNSLKRSEVATVLRNTQKHAHAVVAPQKTFDQSKVEAFRKFCTNFFDDANPPTDPLELAQWGADKLKAKIDELTATVAGSKYAFTEQLNGPIQLLEQAVGKPNDWYLNDFALSDDLLDAKNNVIDPIQAFLSGAQRGIYDNAVALLTTHNSNLGYLPEGSDAAVRQALADENAFRGNRMAQLKQATESLDSMINEAVTTRRTNVASMVANRKTELVGSVYFTDATPTLQETVAARIDQVLARIDTNNQIALLLQLGTDFEETVYPSLLDQLSTPQEDGSGVVPPKHTVSIRNIPVPNAGGLLQSDEDVDTYLLALRAALVAALAEGKRISL